MSEFYASAPIKIRDDLAAAHTRAWGRIGRPGTWWDGATRVAIVAETRRAPSCALCRRRKEALSPAPIDGKHDGLGELPESVVEVVHRVRTDPGRLSERWFRGVITAGLSEEQYIETSASSRTRSPSTRWRAALVSSPFRCRSRSQGCRRNTGLPAPSRAALGYRGWSRRI